MRLGQIARKLSISPSEILGYLATRDITIEENTNTRLDTEHVRLILQKFAPDQLSIFDAQPIPVPGVSTSLESLSEIAVADTNADDLSDQLTSQPVATIDSDTESYAEPEQLTIPLTEESGVIKAPKIALSGLKVLGKIELPEPKKKELDTTTGEQSGVVKEEQPRRSFEPRKQNRDQRSYKNPVALQREREMKEELQKREQKAEQEKARRTQNYLKKVKMSPPTKAVRMVDEPLEQMTTEHLKEEPKSWFGKLIKWLST